MIYGRSLRLTDFTSSTGPIFLYKVLTVKTGVDKDLGSQCTHEKSRVTLEAIDNGSDNFTKSL